MSGQITIPTSETPRHSARAAVQVESPDIRSFLVAVAASLGVLLVVMLWPRSLAFDPNAPVAQPTAPAAGSLVSTAGDWEEHHSVAETGIDPFAFAEPQFATREGALLYRTADTDWRPSVFFETKPSKLLNPITVETDNVFMLAGGSASGMWFSIDGSWWRDVPGTANDRVHRLMTDGVVTVGLAHLGTKTTAIGVSADRTVTRTELPAALSGFAFVRGVGFAVALFADGAEALWFSDDGVAWRASSSLPDDVAGGDLVVHASGVYRFDGTALVGEQTIRPPSLEGVLSVIGQALRWDAADGETFVHLSDRWIRFDIAPLVEQGYQPTRFSVAGERLFVRAVDPQGDPTIFELTPAIPG